MIDHKEIEILVVEGEEEIEIFIVGETNQCKIMLTTIIFCFMYIALI